MELIKSEKFNEIKCDIYKQKDEMFMTINQLANCLEYSNGRKGIDNLIDRNAYLKDKEFSVTLKMRGADGKLYNTRLFTEDGIYEVTMLARTDKAKEFRTFIRGVLKGLRSGNYQIKNQSVKYDAQNKNAEARLKCAKVKEANFILDTIDKYNLSNISQELLVINALEVVLGENKLPRPKLEEKYYTATEIGNELGISANAVGKIANRNNLKISEYGIEVLDKSKYSNKQVSTFRYNEKGKKKIKELLEVV